MVDNFRTSNAEGYSAITGQFRVALHGKYNTERVIPACVAIQTLSCHARPRLPRKELKLIYPFPLHLIYFKLYQFYTDI